MDMPGSSVVEVLTFLLPGFIAAELLYILRPATRPIPFERVVQALIFTMFVQVGVAVVREAALTFGARFFQIGQWTADLSLAWSVVIGSSIGLVLARAANSDRLFAWLRDKRVTKQTPYPSEWYRAWTTYSDRGYLAVLHLKGERRLSGWVQEWPNTHLSGHFVIEECQWLHDDGGQLAGAGITIVRAEDVEMVELVEPKNEPGTNAPAQKGIGPQPDDNGSGNLNQRADSST